jgi:hypothetical protein
MNKRIKELAEQANLKLDELPDDTFIPLEEFAELIVLECVKIADHSNVNGNSIIGERIKEHFGVKE